MLGVRFFKAWTDKFYLFLLNCNPLFYVTKVCYIFQMFSNKQSLIRNKLTPKNYRNKLLTTKIPY